MKIELQSDLVLKEKRDLNFALRTVASVVYSKNNNNVTLTLTWLEI